MQLQFSLAIEDVRKAQAEAEGQALALQANLTAAAVHAMQEEGAGDMDPTGPALAFIASQVKGWWNLADRLLFTYCDGFENKWTEDDTGLSTFSTSSVGYPDWWLQAVGYEGGPPPVAAPTASYWNSFHSSVQLPRRQTTALTSDDDCLRPCVKSCGTDGHCSAACLQHCE